MPYYALSWVLTWFSHDFERFDKVARLFDIFISSSPLMPIYVASSVKCSIYIYIYIYIYCVYSFINDNYHKSRLRYYDVQSFLK